MQTKSLRSLSDLTICIKGAGEIASGVACRLFKSNFHKIVMLEVEQPLAVRRHVSFCEAVYDGTKVVEWVTAVKGADARDIHNTWARREIAVLIDPPGGSYIKKLRPDILVDAILAKKNINTNIQDANLVIALGPGFEAGKDTRFVIETNRGHNLGRIIGSGRAEPDTGIPGAVCNYTIERVLRSGGNGIFETIKKIGDRVEKGDIIGEVDGIKVNAGISGIIRGLIRPGIVVTESMKIGDIDPRGKAEYLHTVSDKARAVGGAVLESILRVYNTRENQVG
ncbi:selenium-dependent molybdenum cofactor biosynthesis protein YqeB [Thermodesulfobacteriota bacterium]